MLVDFRSTGKLRGSTPVDVTAALGPVVGALAEDSVDLSRIRVVCDWVQPFLAGYPDDVGVAVEAINIVTKGVDVTWGLPVCYGNRYARPSGEGHYDFLFPAVLDAQALDTFPADKLIINPDCGLRHLPANVARPKLAAMVEGTATVHRTLPTEHPRPTEHPGTMTEHPGTMTEHPGTSAEPDRRARSVIP